MITIKRFPSTIVEPRSARPRRQLFFWLQRLGLWLAISIFSLSALGALYQSIAVRRDQRAHPPRGEMIDVGGYRLHLYCTGTNMNGSPTVILETGLGSTFSTWGQVQPEVAKQTRVCAYDRAGMGWSDPGPQPRDAQHIAQELHTLLQNAKIPGPYVLVGWSYGGLYVRDFAGRYESEVGGLVLLDSSHPDQWISAPEGKAQFETNARIYSVAPVLARLGMIRLIGFAQPSSGLPSPYDEELKASFAATKDWDAQSAEFLASLETSAQVRLYPSFKNTPLFVLTATEHGTPAKQEQLWQGWQTDLASLSTNSVHQIVDGADHASFWRDLETAKISIAAILKVVEAARTGAVLK